MSDVLGSKEPVAGFIGEKNILKVMNREKEICSSVLNGS